jgi:arsenate reductase (glutaredoxin)
MLQVYHNPRCGKSRDCLAFLDQSKTEYQIIKYLENVPSFEELQSIILKLGIKPIELVRQKEKVWIENFKNKALSDTQIIQSMVSNPILIERPIVIYGDKAVIARPFDKVKAIL